MMLRFNRSRRPLSIGLTVWFVFISVSIQMLHRHTGEPLCGTETAGVCPTTRQWDNPDYWKHLTVPSEQERPGTRFRGLCPVCLFLAKNNAQCRFASLDPPPRSQGSRYAPFDAAHLDSSRDLPAAGPRAPPC
jgi:hypothetical protein